MNSEELDPHSVTHEPDGTYFLKIDTKTQKYTNSSRTFGYRKRFVQLGRRPHVKKHKHTFKQRHVNSSRGYGGFG